MPPEPYQPNEPVGNGTVVDSSRPEVGGVTPPAQSQELPDNFKGSWYKNNCDSCCGSLDANESPSSTTSYITVNALVSTDRILTSKLAKGDFSLLSDPAYVDKFKIEKIPAAGYASVVSHKSGKAEFTYKTSIKIPKDVKDATLFTYTSYDMQKMMQDYDLGFRANFSIESNVPKGQVSSEKLISNGSVPTKSYIYKNSATGKVWDGSVHYNSEQGYMSGASHTTANHSSLSREQIPNIKVKNFADINGIGSLSLNVGATAPEIDKISDSDSAFSLPISTPDSIFLEFDATIDANGNGRISFDVDISRALKNKSSYGSIMENPLSGQATREINTLSNISKIEVFRKRQGEEEEELIAFSSQLAGQSKIATNTLENDSVLGTIEEKNVYKTGIGNIRTFAVTDHSLSEQPDGVSFVYGVSILLTDGIKEFLVDKQGELSDAVAEVESWIFGAFDKTSQTYSASTSDPEPLNNAIAVYVDTLNTVTEGTNKIKAADVLYSFANPVSGNSDGANTVLGLMKSLDASLTNTLPIAKNSQSGLEDSKIKQSDNFFNDSILIENLFESRYIKLPKEKSKYLADFVSDSSAGPVTINKEQYEEKIIISEGGSISLSLDLVNDSHKISSVEALGLMGITVDLSTESVASIGYGLISAADKMLGDDNFVKNVSSVPTNGIVNDKNLEVIAATILNGFADMAETIYKSVEYLSYSNSDVGAKISSWKEVTPSILASSTNTIYKCRIKDEEGSSILNKVFFLGQGAQTPSDTAASSVSTKDIVKGYLDKYTGIIQGVSSGAAMRTAEVSGPMQKSNTTIL